jgi:hypothetical protein
MKCEVRVRGREVVFSFRADRKSCPPSIQFDKRSETKWNKKPTSMGYGGDPQN